MNETSFLQKEAPEKSLPPPTKWEYKEKSTALQRALTDQAGTLNLDFQSPELWEISLCYS